MAVVFALVGLYLHVERNVTGRQVQKVHMQMASRRREWPRLSLPRESGGVVIADVVAAPAGERRYALIRAWCESAWETWWESRLQIVELLASES